MQAIFARNDCGFPAITWTVGRPEVACQPSMNYLYVLFGVSEEHVCPLKLGILFADVIPQKFGHFTVELMVSQTSPPRTSPFDGRELDAQLEP